MINDNVNMVDVYAVYPYDFVSTADIVADCWVTLKKVVCDCRKTRKLEATNHHLKFP